MRYGIVKNSAQSEQIDSHGGDPMGSVLSAITAVTLLALQMSGAGMQGGAMGGSGMQGGDHDREYPNPPTPPAQAPAPPAHSTTAWKVQAKTAATHAGFAAGGNAMDYVTLHLGHVLNCMEGERGKNFNASWGNVCERQGNGLLADLTASKEGMVWLLVAEAGHELVLSGLKSKDLAQTKETAKAISALMTLIAEDQ